MTKKTFLDYDLDPRLCEALAEDGITEPFPIQELTLPVAIEGHDVIGQARTGSGKTFGFGLPALHRIDEARREVQVLVVTPTRELCVQVTEDFEQASRKTDIKILSVYGGVPIEPQTDALKAGVHVVVGTPGRLLDHMRRRNLDLSTCQTLILDEADEMLDMGFLPDVEQLIEKCHSDRHTMLFSATMPTAVVNLARRYMDRPTFIRAEVEQHTIPDRMEQHFLLVHKMDKPRVLARILQTPERGLAVVFTRTKAMADRLVEDLVNYEISAVAIHGDLRQATREKNLDKFKSETSKQDVLVATEVAARGLDIDDVTHVINYDPPEDEKMYLHRIGRTARAGQKGVAVTFATFAEIDRLNAIRKELDLVREPIEETFSTSDSLTKTFDLPDETPWEHLSAKNKGGRSSSNGGSSRKGSDDSSDRGRGSRSTRDDRGGSSRGAGRGASSKAKSDDRKRSAKPESGPADGTEATDTKRSAPKKAAEKRAPAGEADASRSDATDVPESMDGSTPKRSRTRTRSTGGSSSSSSSTSSSRERSSGRGKGDAAADDTTGGSSERSSSSGSGRTRARAARKPSSGDGAPRKGDAASGKGDTASTKGDTASARGEAKDRDGDGGSRGRSSRGGSSRGGSSRGGSSKDGSQRNGGSRGGSGNDRGSRGSDNRRGGNERGSSRNDDDRAEPATTAPGDDARGDGDPGIVRRVKVEHLP